MYPSKFSFFFFFFWVIVSLDIPIRLKDLDTENSSRTYLQGLFDSFPTSEPGLYGDFAVDDGEFQIYEEESDEGLYSIDDNDGEEEEDDDDDDAWRSVHTTGYCFFSLSFKNTFFIVV